MRQVAHGLLVLSLIEGLMNQAPAQFAARASQGWNWSFETPVFAGDSIRVSLAVVDIQPVSRPDLALLILEFRARNQEGLVVQTGRNDLLVYRISA